MTRRTAIATALLGPLATRDPRTHPERGDRFYRGDREAVIDFVERGQVYWSLFGPLGLMNQGRCDAGKFTVLAMEAERCEAE